MNHFKFAVMGAVVAVSGVLGTACSAGSDGLASNADESTGTIAQESNGTPLTAGKFYGSDTLKASVVSAEGLALTTLSYQGTGSGVGEACIRKGNAACGGLITTPGNPYQTIAPMSRDLANSGSGTCADGSTPSAVTGGGACCPGERSNVIGLDGVDAWVKGTTTVVNVSVANLKALFCGNNDGNASTLTYPTGCVTSFSDGHSHTFSLAVATGGIAYRRDDASGTTDTFKTLVGCSNASAATGPFAFCSGVQMVTDAAGGATVTSFNGSGVPTVTSPGTCTGKDATQCIGLLVEANTNSIGYAGNSAQDGTGGANKKLDVNDVPATDDDVRALLSGTAPDGGLPYPLARKLFLNENINYTSDAQEKKFYNWIYGAPNAVPAVPAHLSNFEGTLTAQHFVTCSTAGALQCGTTGNPSVCFVNNSSSTVVNDGRGAGACKLAPPGTNKSCARL